MFLVGAGSMLMGLAWIFYPEPWLLDKSANEILLQTSYTELFATSGNEFLGVYLRGLYGFFGLWMFSLGLLVVAYVKATGLQTKSEQVHLYLVLLVISAMSYTLIYIYIPTTYFVWVSHSVVASIIISYVFSRQVRAGN